MVESEYIGGHCPNCGTHHRVIESIPERPLRMSEVKSLKESNDVILCMSVMGMSGDMAGMDTDEEVTEEIVVGGETATRVLSLYRGHGWVVDIEVEVRDDESAEEVARDVYIEATNRNADAMKAAFGAQ